MQTTITVQYVNQPKPGGKMGNVKTADGQTYFVWPDKLGQFQTNGTYTVEIDEKPGRDGGQPFRSIKSVIANGSGQPHALPAGSYPVATNGPAPPRGTTPIAPPAVYQPRPNGNGGNNTYRETSAKDAERMFVCSILNAAVSAGIVDIQTPTSLINAVNILRTTWDNTFGSNAPHAPASRISSALPPDGDEIPFR
jgi:hypothetical protein